MSRWIDLDSLDPNTVLWIMPQELLKFDQRDPPWPNSLWPWAAWMSTQTDHFDQMTMFAVRRWCERTLTGDVAVRVASEAAYNDRVVYYFDNVEDFDAFMDKYQSDIVRTEDV